MDKPNSVNCNSCIYFNKIMYSSHSWQEKCNRYPEEVSTPSANWCGEFVPRDNLTAMEWVAWKKGLVEDAKA